MSSDEGIEILAKVLREWFLGDPDGTDPWTKSEAESLAIVAGNQRTALSAAGFEIVPRVATPEMIHQATLTFVRENKGIEHAPYVTWAAMIAAATAWNAPPFETVALCHAHDYDALSICRKCGADYWHDTPTLRAGRSSDCPGK